MNPLVKVTSAPGSVVTPPKPSALEQYHVAFVAGASLAQLQRWDDACAAAGVPFFGAGSRGTVSFLFADLLEHTYTTEVSSERHDGNVLVVYNLVLITKFTPIVDQKHVGLSPRGI